MAKRTALALFLTGPVLLSAGKVPAAEKVPVAGKAPLLHVADQIPNLGSVQKSTSEPRENAHPSPRVAGNQPVAALLTMASGGWVAREAIGKQVPLRDPAAVPPDNISKQPEPAVELRPEQEPITDESFRGDAVELNDGAGTSPGEVVELPSDQTELPSQVIELSNAAGEKNLTAPGPISLENLKPVPLTAPQSELSLSDPQTAIQDNAPEESSEGTLEIDPPRRDWSVRSESDRPAATLDDSERITVTPESQQVENATQPGDVQSTLPVRRPTIDLDDAAKRGNIEAAPPVRDRVIELEDAPEVAPSQPVAPVLSSSVARLQRPIEQCLNYYYQRPENAAGRSAWGMMHSIMVYGVDTQLISGRKRYNAIAWLAGNNICRGKRLLTVDRQGIAPRQGVGLQGHQGQLLAILGLVGVPTDYPLYVDRRKFTIEDLIGHEQRECRSGEELTFTLIALAHYIDTDSEWRSKNGERWDFERLLQEELAQPVIGAACGGTHRLMGLSHALRIRKEEGLSITGQWARADMFLQDFTDYAWKLQNRDGSLSTNWFEGRGDNGDVDRKIQTTGHIVEWMLSYLPDDQLQDERLVRAVRFLTAAMSNDPSREKEIGPKGHALRSLAVYHQRVFDAPDPWDIEQTSSGSQATMRRGSSSNR